MSLKGEGVLSAGSVEVADEMTGFGPHLMLDGYGCERRKLEDLDLIYRILEELPQGSSGMDSSGASELMKRSCLPVASSQRLN